MRAEAREHGRRRLRQAEIDLGWVRRLLEEGAYYLACFHSQQAAEKAFQRLSRLGPFEMTWGENPHAEGVGSSESPG